MRKDVTHITKLWLWGPNKQFRYLYQQLILRKYHLILPIFYLLFQPLRCISYEMLSVIGWGLGHTIWAPSQYPKRRLFVRSREVSKPRDWYFKLSYRFEIWQAHRQQCCRSACQISERLDNSRYKSRGFETLRDLTKRRLIGYWDGAQGSGLLGEFMLFTKRFLTWRPDGCASANNNRAFCSKFFVFVKSLLVLVTPTPGRLIFTFLLAILTLKYFGVQLGLASLTQLNSLVKSI